MVTDSTSASTSASGIDANVDVKDGVEGMGKECISS